MQAWLPKEYSTREFPDSQPSRYQVFAALSLEKVESEMRTQSVTNDCVTMESDWCAEQNAP